MKHLQITDVHGKELGIWTIDFETFYDTKEKYSLSNRKSTTVQYIRDPRFKAHGLSYIDPIGNEGWITHNKLQEFFDSIDWASNAMLCQNLAFDGLIAYEHYGVKAAYYLDTMSMARGEWGPGVKNSLKAIAERLKFAEGKIEGELEKTDGIRDLSPEQELALIPYAIRDSQVCRNIYETLYFTMGYPEQELHIIDITLKAFVNPKLEINAALCRAEILEEDLRMKALMESDLLKDVTLSDKCTSVFKAKGIEGLMKSRPCFAELLLSRGIVPPTKPKKKLGVEVDGEITYAFAKDDVELINLGEDPRVSDLVAAWTGSKSTIRKTRAQRFLDVSENGTKTLPIPLQYCGGRTHRWSAGGSSSDGSNPYNPQNLSSSSRNGVKSRLRESIIAPKGFRLVSCDASQIECRVHAWTWGETELLEDFRLDRDPYSKLASEVFGVPVSKKENTHLRFVGKTAELSLSFGVGWKKFFHSITTSGQPDCDKFTKEDAIRTVEYYRNKRTGIVSGWKQLAPYMQMMAAKAIKGTMEFKNFRFQNERVYMPNDLAIQYKDFHWRYNKENKSGEYVYRFKDDWVYIYAAKMGQNNTQSIARSIVAEQAVHISKELPIVLLVHDEIVTLAPENEADDALQFMIDTMRKPPSWCSDLPLDAEGKHGKNYAK